MNKRQYSTDNLNRLLVKKNGGEYPVEGEFSVERSGLTFEPTRQGGLVEQLQLPEKIRFEGKWELDEDYDLVLNLTETKSHSSGRLKLHGKVIYVEADELVFQLHCRKTPNQDVLSLVRLGGRWQADEHNQLEFNVTREDDSEDILRFQGAWQVNKNFHIIYTYQKEELATHTKIEESLILMGYWQIDAKNKLSYYLDVRKNSPIEFKAELERSRFSAAEGKIQYRLSIGVREVRRDQVITLSGEWEVKDKRKLYFNIDYGGQVRQIAFGADVRLTQDNGITFELKAKRGKDLGMSVTFTRDFFSGDAQAFARIVKLEEDSRVEAGVQIKW